MTDVSSHKRSMLLPIAAFLALGSQVPHFLDLSNLLNVGKTKPDRLGLPAQGRPHAHGESRNMRVPHRP
jgi:hypothetical protein